MGLIKVRYPDHHNYDLVREWVEAHCEHGTYYPGQSWADWDGTVGNWVVGGKNRMYQFRNEKDAIMFALRWA
jgi:hypothetical protein